MSQPAPKLPFADLLGIRVTETTADRVVAEMEVRPELCTSPAVLHGGAVMAFADTLGALGTIANLPEGAGTTTIESKTNFIAAPPPRSGRQSSAPRPQCIAAVAPRSGRRGSPRARASWSPW